MQATTQPLSGSFWHPALQRLLRFQTRAKFGRLFASFRNPRKKVLSIVAVLLGLMWLSQTILSVLFREAADPEKIGFWLPLGLLIYSIWHLIKISTRKVVEPFEWTSAEKEFVIAAPVTRTQQITYRLTSIATAALAKAVCFSVIMSPDIRVWYAGFFGMLLGLSFIDLVRVLFELFFYGLGKIGRRVCQLVVLAGAGGCFLYAISNCLIAPTANSDLSSAGGLLFFKNFVLEIISLAQTQVGQYLMAPFAVFSRFVLSPETNASLFKNMLLAVGLNGLAVAAVYTLDRWLQRQCRLKEIANLKTAIAQKAFDVASEGSGKPGSAVATGNLFQTPTTKPNKRKIRVPARLGGAGSLLWRQLLGVKNYRGTVAFSLLVPVLLSCLPLLANHNPGMMLLNLVASMVFYSFLLLPSALILDYRRDINRMAVLKSLPVSPLAMTIGQLAVPVLMCCLFQTVVLAIGAASGKVILWQVMLAGVLLVPVNVLIFAAENYIFILAPYQRNKEGFDVFLRTILTFTAKGLCFGLGLGLALLWVTIIVKAHNYFGLNNLVSTSIFVLGLWGFTLSLAWFLVTAITKRFERFDPSQDTPGVG